MPASRGREQQRRVQPRGKCSQRLHYPRSQWHAPPLAARLLRLLQDALRVDALDAEDACLEIEVAPLEREQFLRAQAGADEHDRDSGETRVELGRDRLDLGPVLEGPLFLASGCASVPDPGGRVLRDQVHSDGVLEHLPKRAEDVVRRERRQL